jgi:hypothetical protein
MVVASILGEEALHIGRAFLYVPEVHPFLSEDAPRLYEYVRMSAGFHISDEEAFIDACDQGDLDYLKCLIGAALVQELDGVLFDETLSLIIVLSDDEWIAIVEAPTKFRQRLSQLLVAQGARKLNKKERRMLTGSEAGGRGEDE